MTTRNSTLLPRNLSVAKPVAAVIVGTFVALSPLAGSAADNPGSAPDDNACVFSGTISDWRALDDRNLVIWAPSRRNAYHVTLGFPLTNLKSEEDLLIIDNNGDGRLCGYGMDQIVISGGAFAEKSTITGMTRLDESGLVALGEQFKMQLIRPPKSQPDE